MSEQAIGERPGDSDVFVFENWDRLTRVYLRSVISPTLLKEHRETSGGHYSEPLMRLLAWCQRRPLTQQYAVKQEADGVYRIISFTGRRGERPVYVSENRFTTLKEARHGVLLRHVQDSEGK